MSAENTAVQKQTQRQTNPPSQRSRRANKPRNRNGNKSVTGEKDYANEETEKSATNTDSGNNTNATDATQLEVDEEEAVCWICAEPVKFYSVSECNHRTCHVCALRLRALYKKLDCTFCKHPQDHVIFTISPDDPYSDFGTERIPFKDAKLSIAFETQEMMEETLILLRFNCPDPDCDYIASGWSDLKVHVRAMHGKMMCDLCIRSKKVFSHEHALYPPSVLYQHLPSLPHRSSNKSIPKDKIEGGIHPMCEFCRECFFSDDELFSHMRERHEECFVCKRNGVRDQYFRNYDHLEQHFHQGHFPCNQGSCLVQKFVVFNTAMDLQAHMVEQHGTTMSSKDRKDIRRVVADFDFEEVPGSGDRRRNRGRDRDRESELAPQGALQAQANGRRRVGFGATLTTESVPASGSSTPPAPPQPSSRRQSPSPSRESSDPLIAERHAAFTSRLNAVVSNSSSATAAVKAAIRSYRSSESGARDLISTFFIVLDRDIEATASLIISLVDLLDDEDKRKDLLTAWNGFKIEQRRDFPDLVPTSTGSAYAGVAGGRVLNVKHSTTARSSQQSTRQVWDRVARAASSSSSIPAQNLSAKPAARFPVLHQPSSSSTPPTFRQAQYSTPWASASIKAPAPSPVSAPRISSQNTSSSSTIAAPQLSNSAFPTLPTSTNARPKPATSGNHSLRKIIGNNAAPPVVWGSAGKTSDSDSGTPNNNTDMVADTAPEPGPAKGKKKGKEKQMLFTLGSFPT